MIRVATYNIRKCVGLDWTRRPDRIVKVLAELNADIVALQEADRRLGKRTGTLPLHRLERETGLRLVRINDNGQSHGWCGNAILVSDRIEVASAEPVPLPGLEPRGAVIAELGLGQRTFRVIGTHLGLVPAFRRRQAVALVAQLDRRSDGTHEIVMGDFNDFRSNHGPLAALHNRLDVTAPGPSFHASYQVAALDRIFFDRYLTASTSAVHRSELSEVASDHLPVWADLDVADD